MPPLDLEEPGTTVGASPASNNTSNLKTRTQNLGKILATLSDSSSSVVAKLNAIAAAITSSLIGGSTGTSANRVLVSKGTGARALQAVPGVSIDPATGAYVGGDMDVHDITAHIGAFSTGLTKGGVNVAIVNQAIGGSWTFAFPENSTVPVYLNFAFGWTITSVTTITTAGTATVTVLINTTPLGGTANSASTSQQTQAHSSANVVATTDKLQITFASVSSDCVNLCVTVQGTRVLAS